MAKRKSKSSDGNGGNSNPILGAGAKKKESLTNRATSNNRSATRKSFSTVARVKGLKLEQQQLDEEKAPRIIIITML